MEEKEIWKDIPGYEGLYQASNLGRIKSLQKVLKFGCGYRCQQEKILKGGNSNGYRNITLCKDNIHTVLYIHRLIWITFNGTIPEGMQVNHINEVKTDNRLINLNLMSCKENINWGTGIERMMKNRKGKTARKVIYQCDLCGNIIKEWKSSMEVERELGYCSNSIGDCCRKRNHHITAYGYIWRYSV